MGSGAVGSGLRGTQDEWRSAPAAHALPVAAHSAHSARRTCRAGGRRLTALTAWTLRSAPRCCTPSAHLPADAGGAQAAGGKSGGVGGGGGGLCARCGTYHVPATLLAPVQLPCCPPTSSILARGGSSGNSTIFWPMPAAGKIDEEEGAMPRQRPCPAPALAHAGGRIRRRSLRHSSAGPRRLTREAAGVVQRSQHPQLVH